jgi:hypothetical protein
MNHRPGTVSVNHCHHFQRTDETDETDNGSTPCISTDHQYYSCPDSSCTKVYANCYHLERHLAIGNHSYSSNSRSGMDTAADMYVSKCDSIRNSHDLLIQTVISGSDDDGLHEDPAEKRAGWALKCRRKATRFSQQVKDYLFRILEECDRTGKRPDSASLSEELKKVTDEHGERLFKREEWLSSSQIKGYIASYLSKKSKNVTEPPEAKKQLLSEKCLENVSIDEDEKLAEVVSAIESNDYVDEISSVVHDVFASVNVQ